MSPTEPMLAPVATSDFDVMLAIRIGAMRESLERLGRFDPARARERLAQGAANRFYLRHGFVQVGEGEFDLHYRRSRPQGVLA